MQNEKTVERVAEAPITTEIGELRLLAFKDDLSRDLHLALVKGVVDPAAPTLLEFDEKKEKWTLGNDKTIRL